jgi:predicted O-linked N-acetylglucosamine transferase (SPINDLY family)
LVNRRKGPVGEWSNLSCIRRAAIFRGVATMTSRSGGLTELGGESGRQDRQRNGGSRMEQSPANSATWDRAVRLHASGRLCEAAALYRRILDAEPLNARALHMLGTIECQSGSGAAGLELIDRAIAIDPKIAEFHSHRGVILNSTGDLHGAIEAFRRALAIDPGRCDTLSYLAFALWQAGEAAKAIAAFRSAYDCDPQDPQAAANLGAALIDNGAPEEAIAVLEGAHAHFPDDRQLFETLSVAYGNAILGLFNGGEPERSLEMCRKALALDPRSFEATLYAGRALTRSARLDEAIEMLRTALEIRPENAEAQYELSVALYGRQRFGEAIECCLSSIRLDPADWRAYNCLGNAYRISRRLPESVAALRQALQIRPDDPLVWNNLGAALAACEDLDSAMGAFERAIELKPDLSSAHCNLGYVRKAQGDLDSAIASCARAVEIAPDNESAHSNRLFAMYFHPACSLERIWAEHAAWRERRAAFLFDPSRSHGNDRSPGRRLRVGYVAAYFRDHCQSFFTVPLLSHHDHDAVEVYAYSDSGLEDAITCRLKDCCDHWRNTAGISDSALAELVRDDRIDILIDLTLHMSDNRMLAFARKPAPVQATWLGYPGTTGLTTIDYRLTDPYLDPVDSAAGRPAIGTNDRYYTETSVRLPHSFWIYDPLAEASQAGQVPAIRNGFVTFGCLNNFCKVNPGTLALWARVMTAVSGSRLLLLAPAGRARQAVIEALAASGVDGSRVEFTGRLPRAQYLDLYNRIDIALDSFPYNGHTTTLDALWMGVPLVTMPLEAPVGRAGWCQLSNIGIPDMCAHDEVGFVDQAVRLATDLDALGRLRFELRDRLAASPLCDAPAFARAMEQAYRAMWERHCAS